MNSLTISSYGARPKTKSIFRKNLEDLNDISTDKTVPILPTKLPLSVPITSTPLASTVQKRQTIDTRVINRPTRSNKNYVQLKSIPDPEYLFKRNVNKGTSKSFAEKIASFFSPSPKKSKVESIISPIKKIAFDRSNSKKEIESIIYVPSVIKSPGTAQSNHISVGQIQIIKKSSGTTDSIIEIPEDLTVNEISNFPVKNTENKTIFIQNNAEISVTNHNLITTANGIDCQSAVEEEDTLLKFLIVLVD